MFIYLKLCLANAIHNFKWVNITYDEIFLQLFCIISLKKEARHLLLKSFI